MRRLSLRLTQQQVTERTGRSVSQTRVSAFERGLIVPRKDWASLAAALETSVEALFGRGEK